MRYLRKYNVFEGFKWSDSVGDDIKDIFLDLVDKGFNVRVIGREESTDYGFITILKSPEFDIDSDIIDCILRLIDYLRISNLYLNSASVVYSKPGQFSENKFVTNVTEEGLFISELGGGFRIKVDWPINSIKLKYSKFNI
jgi:hypothetical protein